MIVGLPEEAYVGCDKAERFAQDPGLSYEGDQCRHLRCEV